MIHRLLPAAVIAVLGTAVMSCQRPPPPTRADAQARTDCRAQVEREYNAQNRADLTRRDERDFAYAGTYNTGIPSRGLGAEYHREQMVSDCLRSTGDTNSATTPGVGPVFSPANSGAGSSSLRP